MISNFILYNQRNRLSLLDLRIFIFFFFYRKIKFVLYTTYDNDESIFDILYAPPNNIKKQKFYSSHFNLSHYLRVS